jgi:hypothetical protein
VIFQVFSLVLEEFASQEEVFSHIKVQELQELSEESVSQEEVFSSVKAQVFSKISPLEVFSSKIFSLSELTSKVVISL